MSAGRIPLHLPVPWVFVLTYLLGVVMETAFPPGARSPHALQISGVAGAILFAAGAALAAWAWTIFHRARTTTIPGRASTKLVTSGPYRVSRNPMYVGLSFAYLGEAGLLRQVWPVVLLPLVLAYVNWLVIPLEETRLQEVFPEEYERYRAQVRRWI